MSVTYLLLDYQDFYRGGISALFSCMPYESTTEQFTTRLIIIIITVTNKIYRTALISYFNKVTHRYKNTMLWTIKFASAVILSNVSFLNVFIASMVARHGLNVFNLKKTHF